jgi:hypothetical protein
MSQHSWSIQLQMSSWIQVEKWTLFRYVLPRVFPLFAKVFPPQEGIVWERDCVKPTYIIIDVVFSPFYTYCSQFSNQLLPFQCFETPHLTSLTYSYLFLDIFMKTWTNAKWILIIATRMLCVSTLLAVLNAAVKKDLNTWRMEDCAWKTVS